MGERIFASDWRACQEEHLRAVVAAGDVRNQATLVQVLQDIGFDADRLAALGIPADTADAVEASTEIPGPAAEEPVDLPSATGDEGSESPDAPPAEDSELQDEEQDLAGDEDPAGAGESDAANAQLSLF